VSEKSITWQQFWLNGGHKSLIGTLQSRPRACSGNKFVVNENRRGVSSVTSTSKSEILAKTGVRAVIDFAIRSFAGIRSRAV